MQHMQIIWYIASKQNSNIIHVKKVKYGADHSLLYCFSILSFSLWNVNSKRIYDVLKHHQRNEINKDTNLYIRLKVKKVYSLPIASIQS